MWVDALKNNFIYLCVSQKKSLSCKRKLSIFLSLFYLFVAPVIQVLPVYAAEPAIAHTVWDFMVTQLVGANCIITDSTVLSAYGSALGSLNAATATAAEIDTAIATAAANCGVDLAPVFANTAASAAQVGVEAAAATAGENLATSCAGFYAAGEGSAVLPAIGQTLMDVGGIAGIVAGIAYIGKMVAETMGDVIKYGQEIDFLSYLSGIPTAPATGNLAGSSMATVVDNNNGKSPLNTYLGNPVGYVLSGSDLWIYAMNISSDSTTFQQYSASSQTWSSVITLEGYRYYKLPGKYSPNTRYLISGGIKFNDISGVQNYINKFKIGEYHPVFSSTPSIASSNGYQKYNPSFIPDNTEVQTPGFPEIKPLPDYANGYGLEPINPPSYQALVDAILEVPGNPSYLEEQLSNDNSIAEIVQPLISPHIVPLPSVNPDPQPTGTPDPNPTGTPDPNPTGTPDPDPNPNPRPTTIPFPDPDTVPDSPPIIQDTPESDIVPVPVPYPDPSTPTEQEKDDTTQKIPPYDLTKKFPFCIPFDILAAFKLFTAGREAPHFVWHIPFGAAGEQVIDIDLAAWDDIATLGRFLQLILFIIILGVGTNNLLRP